MAKQHDNLYPPCVVVTLVLASSLDLISGLTVKGDLAGMALLCGGPCHWRRKGATGLVHRVEMQECRTRLVFRTKGPRTDGIASPDPACLRGCPNPFFFLAGTKSKAPRGEELGSPPGLPSATPGGVLTLPSCGHYNRKGNVGL